MESLGDSTFRLLVRRMATVAALSTTRRRADSGHNKAKRCEM
jgi:hypothetical protein